MPDREKVIKGLECCKKGGPLNLGSFCGVCPYQTELPTICFFRLRDDAIDLLKEQKTKTGKWLPCKASIHPYGYDVKCSECGLQMGSTFGYHFCPKCGAKMD